MGLTFYYKGKLRNPQQADEIIQEVRDISISMTWEYQVWPLKSFSEKEIILNENHPNIYDIKGISVTPKNCESLFLTFLPDGTLISPVYFVLEKDKKPRGSDFLLHTKTQFAGVETHLALMKLLIYLQQKYFAKLHVEDEGRYWETRDEKILRATFHRYEELFETVVNALSGIKPSPDDTPDTIADKIERVLKQMIDRKNI
jgi:hypothetical protein